MKIGKLENCRYVGMISPDITISNHRLRWAVDGMRFTAPLLLKTGKLEVLHLFRWFTHTCSETSYRIADVECIARAQTLHLNLTGESG